VTLDGTDGLEKPAILCRTLEKRYVNPGRHIPAWQRLLLGTAFSSRAHVPFHALRDVSLSVRRGESVALLGRNGSGKSTLMKMLAGVVQPTSGSVEVNGSVAALLELGAGMHPELTGYENVFLGARILGIPDTVTRERLGELAEFTGLGRFLEAPIKTYSSGMFARLAFAIATSMVPDILLIDEILSVGDADFQARSFGRIQGFRSEGRTIILVSHHLEAVERFCDRAIWLERGRVVMDGPSVSVVSNYRAHLQKAESGACAEPGQATDAATAELSVPELRWIACTTTPPDAKGGVGQSIRMEAELRRSAGCKNFEAAFEVRLAGGPVLASLSIAPPQGVVWPVGCWRVMGTVAKQAFSAEPLEFILTASRGGKVIASIMAVQSVSFECLPPPTDSPSPPPLPRFLVRLGGHWER